MFERFTEPARKVVVLAQEETRCFNHNYIGTEHLLLGLLREDEGVAARALGSLNVTLDEVREQVESIVGRGDAEDVGEAPLDRSCKKALKLALRESLQLGYMYIGTEHLLLGLVQEKKAVANRILSNLGASRYSIRQEVVRMLDNVREATAHGVAPHEDSGYAKALRASQVRARVEGLLVHARCGVTDEERALPQALRVDLEYKYRAGEGDEVEETVDYGTVLQDVAELLEREEFKLLETGMRRAGAHVLERFPEIWEVAVRVTKLHVPVARTVSGVSVEAIFRR